MERELLKSMLCDRLEKAVSHKYVRKESDGKGGFRYIYTEKETERSISMNGRTRYRKVKRITPSHPISL